MYDKPRFLLAGDRGFLIEFGASIDPEINQKVRQIFLSLERMPIEGVTEIIPTYRSILIFYDPFRSDPERLKKAILERENKLDKWEIPPPEIVEIQVAYGDDFGPDLEFVAQHNNLTPEEVIQIHTSGTYLIYMLGFTPGFPFLGGLSEKIFTPRLEKPRQLVPAGSVGIAKNQTGIYPIDSPGGWQLIGRTPIKLYDPTGSPPILLKAGNYLRFKSISRKDFQEIASRYND
ncbi:MAG: allophanate hydrolase [Deltaproteobacteria bacterium]|jgi:KipI family sensor histidine kinase inhibitor|nr:MAG: allophanate hydrolase [Deltaproteobacteria bacterium]